ncbi:MAG: glycosyltransferase [Saprospiraceae bacterium]
MDAHQLEIKNYFNSMADNFVLYRSKRKYYWNSILKYCSYYLNSDQSVLEIGCGAGDLIGNLPGKNKVGIDFADKLVEIARLRYKEVTFMVLEAESLKLDQKFDVIILSNTVGYFQDVQLVLEQLKSVCHHNTKIIITYYNKTWEPLIKLGELIGLKRKAPEQNWLSRSDLKNLVYLAGLEPYKQINNMMIPYDIPIFSFLMNRFLVKLPLLNLLSLNQYTFARPQALNLPEEELDQLYSATIVIPARNESGNIENAILRLPKIGKHTEIIFVEGNSTDDTWEKIVEIQGKFGHLYDIKIMKQDGKGKGDAVRKGFEHASGDILFILDADLTVPPEELTKFYRAIASGKGDFINGCRLVYPMESQAMRTLNTIGNHFFSKAFSWLLEQPIKDTLCGTKVIFKSDYEQLIKNRSFFGNFDPFGDFDLLFGAYKLGLKIIDLPIKYRDRTYGETNISRFSHGLLLLRMVVFASKKIKFW